MTPRQRLTDLWAGLVRGFVQDVPDDLAVAEFGQPNAKPAPEPLPIHDAALLAALETELLVEQARAYLAAIETGDDLIFALGGDA